ncbi:MAG: purine-nucleoside phosphorylase [Spirochaetes bacterium]|nr:purine-nucleoside phosphorylase [Spirochaetota bacterium]
MDIEKKVKQSVNFIKQRSKIVPSLGLILGSGLGFIAEHLLKKNIIPYKDIPHFPQSTVKGHANALVFGVLNKMSVVAMKGRFHYYEGFSAEDVSYPVRVLKELGIDTLIVTNAAGGINPSLKVGDLMVIEDHLNMMGTNPLIGWHNDKAPRFIDLTFGYDPELIKIVLAKGHEMGLKIKKGIYAAMTGPSYETPGEIRMLKILGADAVGMSTVPEVIVANQLGIRVIGISLITNLAAGIEKKRLDHKEVIEAAQNAREKFARLIIQVVKEIASHVT